jgi:hypothetical protein
MDRPFTGKGRKLLSRMSGESSVARKPKMVPLFTSTVGSVSRAKSRGKLSKMRRKR